MSSEFTLQDELYVKGNRLCRLYLPIIILEEGTRVYWIQYIDDNEVTAAYEHELKKANRFEKALYGRSIKNV